MLTVNIKFEDVPLCRGIVEILKSAKDDERIPKDIREEYVGKIMNCLKEHRCEEDDAQETAGVRRVPPAIGPPPSNVRAWG